MCGGWDGVHMYMQERILQKKLRRWVGVQALTRADDISEYVIITVARQCGRLTLYWHNRPALNRRTDTMIVYQIDTGSPLKITALCTTMSDRGLELTLTSCTFLDRNILMIVIIPAFNIPTITATILSKHGRSKFQYRDDAMETNMSSCVAIRYTSYIHRPYIYSL